MRARLNSAIPFILVWLFFCLLSGKVMAANADVQWFVSLVKTYNGKVFCARPNTTFKELSDVLLKFSKAHPEFNDQLTDPQVLQGLAESYPCPMRPTRELANTDLSKIGETVAVTPKGEFSSINTKRTIEIILKLRGTLTHENDSLVDEITKNSGNYMPPTLFAVADLLYRQGDIDDAIFWFHAAQVRGYFDASLCTDISARSAISAIVQQLPKDLIKRQFDDLPKLKNTIDRVLKWDEETPYNYDHRWISLHGMRAINSGLGNESSTSPLTVPRENWDSLAKVNRDQYQKSFDKAIDTIQKQTNSH